MNTKEIAAECGQTLESLFQLISSFSDEQINIVPFEGSWTAGQLAKHLVISGAGFIKIMNGPVKDPERNPAAMVDKLKQTLSNLDVKLKAPEFVIPLDTFYSREELLRSVEKIKAKALHAVENLDLTKLCLAFQLPTLGYLTRLEAIYFVIYHTQRHLFQMRNIYEKVKNKL